MKNYKKLAVVLTIFAAVIDTILIILSRLCFYWGYNYTMLDVRDIATFFTIVAGVLLYILGAIFVVAAAYIAVFVMLLITDAFKH